MMWLHYVGKGLYTPRRFEREAKRYGANRAIAPKLLRAFKWGDTVLTAEHRRIQDKEYAIVFGYFTVSTITLPWGFDLGEDDEDCSPGGGASVSRACGSYEIVESCPTKLELREIAERILRIEKEIGQKIRVFIGGHYRGLKVPILIEGEKFHRGFSKIDIDINLESMPTDETKLVFIRDYSQRRYLRKKELAAIDTILLDEYIGGWTR